MSPVEPLCPDEPCDLLDDDTLRAFGIRTRAEDRRRSWRRLKARLALAAVIFALLPHHFH